MPDGIPYALTDEASQLSEGDVETLLRAARKMKTMKKIVGIGHQKNVGKDTFAGYCIDVLRTETRKLKIVRRGFADKIYEFLFSTYAWAGFRTKAFYDSYPNDKNIVLLNGKTPRQMLIEVGTPVMRAYDDDVWINANLKNDDYDILFITDLRFPNEFNAVTALGGHTVRITKPGLPIPTDVADCALNGWEDKWMHNFDNDGDMAKLYNYADNFVRKFLL